MFKGFGQKSRQEILTEAARGVPAPGTVRPAYVARTDRNEAWRYAMAYAASRQKDHESPAPSEAPQTSEAEALATTGTAQAPDYTPT